MEKESGFCLTKEQVKAMYLAMCNSMGVSLRMLAELIGEWGCPAIRTEEELGRSEAGVDFTLDLAWAEIANEAEGLAQVARTLERLADGLRPRGHLELDEDDLRELSWHIDPEDGVVLVDHCHHQLGLTEEQSKALSL